VRVSLTLDSSYPIAISPVAALPGHLDTEKISRARAIVISDENVWNIHGDAVGRMARSYWDHLMPIVLQPGERMKALDHLELIYDRAFEQGIDRDSVVVALGGGVVGDLAGFAAATLLRGLPLVHIPTSLIAQVDSSIGGKTGINHPAGKNLIGSFYAPRLIQTDPSFLLTLPEREYASGLAEVVKHALIADAEFAMWLAARWQAIIARELDVLGEMVLRAINVKVDVVQEDALEHGRRAILNFGHTFGHAIEKVAGYGTFTHGEAVAVGMKAAIDLSQRLDRDVDLTLATDLVGRLPVQPPVDDLDVDALVDAMRIDKKVREGSLRFVILEKTGRAAVRANIPAEWVREACVFAKSA
jgi:3-dehydroquinate synthase